MEDIVKLLHESDTTQEDDRLAAVAAGGCSKKYFGKHYSVEEIEKLDDKERKKLYARYETILGREMIKCLGSSVVNILVKTLGYGLDGLDCELDNEHELQKDLEEDPFLSTAVSGLLCDLYYKYGNYLAPLSAALITLKHVKYKNISNYIDGSGNESASGGEQRCRNSDIQGKKSE